MHRFLDIIEKFCIFVPVSGKNLLIRCVKASIMENISNPSFQSSPSPAEKSGFYFCMKYSLTLNQKAVYDCGLEKSIDFIDLAILSTIKHVIGMSKIQTVFSEDKTYYWISYSHLVNELPLLGIKQDGIYRRIKKYIELGLMSANPLNSGGKTYFHISELFDNLFSDTYKKIDNTPTDENPTLRMKPRTPTDETPNPLNIIEHNTNNNKEINKESFDLFLEMVNRVTSKKYRGDTKSKRNFLARVKQGYKIEDMEKALKAAMQVKTHIETKFMYLTPEFITRPDKLETYLNAFKEEKQGMSNEAYREFVGLNN